MFSNPPTEKQIKCMHYIINRLDLYGRDKDKKYENMWFEDCTKQMASEFISEYLAEAQSKGW